MGLTVANLLVIVIVLDAAVDGGNSDLPYDPDGNVVLVNQPAALDINDSTSTIGTPRSQRQW